jgi:hypothetical protein
MTQFRLIAKSECNITKLTSSSKMILTSIVQVSHHIHRSSPRRLSEPVQDMIQGSELPDLWLTGQYDGLMSYRKPGWILHIRILSTALQFCLEGLETSSSDMALDLKESTYTGTSIPTSIAIARDNIRCNNAMNYRYLSLNEGTA